VSPPGTVPAVAPRALLKVGDVMRLLGCSRSTVHRRVQDGSLPAVRIHGLLRFRPETLEAFVQVNEDEIPELVEE
jgi:excisionase family DNA binding protein